MINIEQLSKLQLKEGVISEDLFQEKELMLEKLLKDPQNIPYFFYDNSKPKIIGLKLRLNDFLGHNNHSDYELIIKNFYEGVLKLKRSIDGLNEVCSRIIFDPCGFGYRPIRGPSQESPRVFLATSLISEKRELGLTFTLIRGGCDEKPSYSVESFDNTRDILDIMDPYIQIGKSNSFLYLLG